MSAPQIAAPGDTDLGSAENQTVELAGLIDPPEVIRHVGPVEPLLRPEPEPEATADDTDAENELEQTSSRDEVATVTELHSSAEDGGAADSAENEEAPPELPTEAAEEISTGSQPSASSEAAAVTPAVPAAPVAPAPPPEPEPPQEPKRRKFRAADLYPLIFWISVIVGLSGQIIGFGSQFGGLWYSYCGAVIVGGIFELTMITASETAMRRIGHARPAYEWAPFLAISIGAAGVAAYMNFTHWVWAGPNMALYFGGLTVGGFLGHLLDGLYDALRDRRKTLAYEQDKAAYEKRLAEDADEDRKAWRRYQRAIARTAEQAPAPPAPAKSKSSTSRKSKKSLSQANLDAIVAYAKVHELGARAALKQYRENHRISGVLPSEKTVHRALHGQSAS